MALKKKKQRIVIKIGTNVLTSEDGTMDLNVIFNICSQVTELKNLGHEVVLVSSGAVGAGKSIYELTSVKNPTIQRQIYSALGQVKLMNLYTDLFQPSGYKCAQVLVTKENFIGGMDSYKNMRNCFRGLLKDSIIPIVNENDVVSLRELMFTDNDELAGLTAFMIDANMLIILSNMNGLYTGDPDDPETDLIGEVKTSDFKKIFKYISSKKSSGGRGGMRSKLKIATMAADKGIDTYVANGKEKNVVLDIFNGINRGTRFVPNTKRQS